MYTVNYIYGILFGAEHNLGAEHYGAEHASFNIYCIQYKD